MKKIKILTLMLFGLNGYAQYHPFLADSSVWNVSNSSFLIGIGMVTHSIAGDSIIAGNSYSLILTSASQGLFFGPDSVYIFEDTVLQKVYWRDEQTGISKILYDFSLLAGDSVYLDFKHIASPNVLFVVDSVYSIQTINGPRKAIKLSSPGINTGIGVHHDNIYYNSDGLLWIEGIGASNGPLYLLTYNQMGSNFYDFLTCKYQAGGQVYQNPGVLGFPNTCYFLYMGLGETPGEIPFIGPNPFNESISIKFKESTGFTIHLYDVYGREVLTTGELVCREYELVPGSKLPGGLYFLEIVMNNPNKKIQFKLIKQ